MLKFIILNIGGQEYLEHYLRELIIYGISYTVYDMDIKYYIGESHIKVSHLVIGLHTLE